MFASIDIGTNTVLLLIAKYDGQKLKVVHEDQRIPRLGKGVDEHRNLDPQAVDRVVEALKEYRRVIDHYYSSVQKVMVTATSAVRDAANRDEFMEKVNQQTGFEVRLLSGEEEAEWTYRGALSVLPPDLDLSGSLVTLDIGGGSSEISMGKEDELLDFYSFDIGSVRFTERFIHSDPPQEEEIKRCRAAIREAFEDHPFTMEGEAHAIGVAGTVTSLAFMEADLTDYDSQQLAGITMSRSQVQKWIKKISNMTSDELLNQHPVVMEGRADVFLPGILILDEFLKRYEFEEFYVSTGGIRHGAILKLYEKTRAQ